MAASPHRRRCNSIKPIFTKAPSINFRLSVCVAASLALLAGEQKGLLAPLRATLTSVVHPLQQLVSSPTQFVGKARELFADRAALAEKNAQLHEEALLLQAKLLKFAALEQENLRLRGLLDTSFKLGEQVMIAELLSVNVVPYEHVVMVNKGSRFGVYAGQPVMDADGVVGQVLRVTPYSAEVILITDPNHAIPVQVNRNGLRTIAQGTGQIDKLILPYLSGNADIQAGDLLVTSGMGGIFPQGYPVATVTAVTSQQGSPLAKVLAAPVAKLDRSRELLMVWSKPEPIPRVPDPLPKANNPADHAAK
ncbi:MAG: rod shape-determining protein MreC [Candidatus Methylumidiphilus sp.]